MLTSRTITAPAAWIHEVAPTETVEQLIRRAMNIVQARDMATTPAKVSRLVRAHIRKSGSLQIAAETLEAYFMPHADPTGETAVNNIMRGTR